MKKVLTGSLLCVLLAGCSLIPAYNRPEVNAAADWKNGTSGADSQAIAPDWWKSFNSAELNRFMAEALDQNNDLRAALDRIEQARAQEEIAGAALLPSLDASGDASVSRSKATGSGHGTTAIAAGNKARYTRNASLGLNASYEVDLFGANRATAETAEAGYKGSVFDQQALALTTMANVADAYFLVVNLRERVAISRKNLESFEDILRIVNARFEAGASSALDVAQQKTSLATAQASLATLQKQEAQAENALAVLLGRTPEALTVQADSLQDLSVPDLAPTQPSALVARRPDVRSAEQALIAANADIGVARANFFPSLNLGAGLSLASTSFTGGPLTTVVSGTSSLLAPIFSGGLLEGSLWQTKARKAELVENYRKSVLTSFQEVEDALASVKAASAREDALKEAVAQAQKSYSLSRELYNSGAVDFETLLNAQQAMLSTEDTYAAVRLERLEASVDLYAALGGGWQSDEPVTAQAFGPNLPDASSSSPQPPAKKIDALTSGPGPDTINQSVPATAPGATPAATKAPVK